MGHDPKSAEIRNFPSERHYIHLALRPNACLMSAEVQLSMCPQKEEEHAKR